MFRNALLLGLLLSAAAAAPVVAAPVPRAAEPDPATVLAGWTWQMRWGTVDGAITLGADGSMFETYGESRYVGAWWVERGELVIVEHIVDETGRPSECANVFRFKLASVTAGRVRGATEYGTELILIRDLPQR